MSKNRIKKNLIIILTVLLLVALLGVQVTYREGMDDGIVYIRRIPLYIKMTSFIERDYHYRKLSRNITFGCNSDIEKIRRIFDWTYKNIYSGVPEPLNVKDNHVLNIIIRGYGTPDQSADVFSTLCTYAGFPARMHFIFAKESEEYLIVSLVEYKGRVLLFDTFYDNWFENKNNEVASISDIINDPSLVDKVKNKPIIRNVRYEDYFKALSEIHEFKRPLRAELQMPFKRLWFELCSLVQRREISK